MDSNVNSSSSLPYPSKTWSLLDSQPKSSSSSYSIYKLFFMQLSYFNISQDWSSFNISTFSLFSLFSFFSFLAPWPDLPWLTQGMRIVPLICCEYFSLVGLSKFVLRIFHSIHSLLVVSFTGSSFQDNKQALTH